MPGLTQSITIAAPSTRLWAFVPGVRELVIVALVAVALYGRSTSVRRIARVLPTGWVTRSKGANQPTAQRWVVDRWMLVFTLLAGAGVVAWVATSIWVVQSATVP